MTTTEPIVDPVIEDTPADPIVEPDLAEDPAAELEKWKHFARQHEKQAKANADAAAKLQAIEDAAKTESEKSAEALATALADAATAKSDLARLTVATSKGLSAEMAARLIGETPEELSEDADRLLEAMKPATPPGPKGSADGGPQGQGALGQIDQATIKTMTPEAIVEAKAAGRLNDLLGIK